MASGEGPGVDRDTREILRAADTLRLANAAALGLVVAADRRVLVLSNRRYGGWGLPGGKRERGDADTKATCSRELREELGVVVFPQQMSLLGEWIHAQHGVERLVRVYHVRAVHGEPLPRERGTEMAWFSDEHLFASRPFGDFYAMHFPDGFDHLMPTAFYS
jgi:8-oxo-dGTP pyrophosphatase MutT (NUDIX family)